MFLSARRVLRLSSSVFAIVLAFSGASCLQAAAEQKTYSFHIPAESTAQALTDFSKQASIQIVFPYDVVADHQAPAVTGQLTRMAVLDILLKGTNLEIAKVTDEAIVLRVKVAAAPEATTEVIVTGTRIRGGSPASPVHTITRNDIARSGFSQIGDLMRALPENFAGGQNPGVMGASATNQANQNLTDASTVNLRGLGADATLVLLNGHRMAADGFAQGIDISSVPINAIQRIEVVTDGASALYGSDAVSGVVNILLRKDYNGGSATARYGAATQGGGQEQSYDLSVGRARSGGYVLGEIEFAKQDAVLASQRDVTSGMTPDTTLARPYERSSAFFSAGRDLTDALSVSLDALLSSRRSSAVVHATSSGASYHNYDYSPTYNVAGTLAYHLPQDWKLNVVAVSSGAHNRQLQTIPASGYASPGTYDNHADSLEVTSDGALGNLPSGPLKAAFGAGYRSEGYVYSVPSSGYSYGASRQVAYAYAELLAPLVNPARNLVGLKALDVDLSVRTEHYSDFGEATNPKLGVRYVPFDGLTLRTSWGTSFKAPTFNELSQPIEADYADIMFFGGAVGTNTNALLLYGGNPDLKPEKARSFTLGADYRFPNALDGKLSLTYFRTKYRDRVVHPITPLTAALSNPLFSSFVNLTPTDDQKAAAVAEAYFFENFTAGAYDPTSVGVIVEDRWVNATTQTIEGVDADYRQSWSLGSGELSVNISGSWLRVLQQTIPSYAATELTGTIFNQPRFKARGSLTWSDGPLSATLSGNYLGAETDVGVAPSVRIGSWSTMDAAFAYRLSGRDVASGVTLTLSASNLLDRDPPHAASPALAYAGMHYDSTNASVIGRYVRFAISKSW